VDDQWLRRLVMSIATEKPGACMAVAFIASVPQEGTTSIVVNVARGLEEDLRRRVVVVDANLAAPALHDHYNAPPRPGLAELLRGDATLREAVHLSERRTLAVLPVGNCEPREQSLLLSHSRLPTVLEQLRREPFDVCLLDCPAVLQAPEAAIVARHADACYLVIHAERTRWDAAERAVTELRDAGCNVAGTILNRTKQHIPGFLYRLL
jgi:Mrp family chromosome partitioning ATPase